MQPLLARRQDRQGWRTEALACPAACATCSPCEAELAEARAAADARTDTQQAEDTSPPCRARFGAGIADTDSDSASPRYG
jgi:hypothetical protein